jgi:hypothetical protein
MGKNIEVVIGRRFKKQGMSWDREGVNNLLRTLWHNKSDWDAFWSRRQSCGVSFPPNQYLVAEINVIMFTLKEYHSHFRN